MKKKPQGKDDITGRLIIFSIITALVIIFDRVTKYLAINHLGSEFKLIPGFLSLNFTLNTGAAFGILSGKTIFLSVISVLFLVFILFSIKSILEEKYYFAIALIFGGAVSNLFDRIFYGYVVDFIYISYWPVFNIADSAISIGAIILIIYLFKESKNK